MNLPTEGVGVTAVQGAVCHYNKVLPIHHIAVIILCRAMSINYILVAICESVIHCVKVIMCLTLLMY